MSAAARRLLGLPRRLPDTTVRDVLVKLSPDSLRQALYRLIRAAHRRKALKPVGLPFGVVSLDGKFTVIDDARSSYVSASKNELGAKYGKLGTVTATLISAAAKPCLDARPIGRYWGEETVYPFALYEQLQAYGSLGLFKLVVYDAGACSRTNARSTVAEGLHYMFRLKKGKQPKLTAAAVRELGDRTLDEASAVVCGTYLGKPERRSVYLSERVSTWPSWTGMQTVVRVLWELLDDEGRTVKSDERYYVSSLPMDALDGGQWIAVARSHWAVENNCHHTFDAVLKEDDRPWIRSDARGTLAVLLLRRMAYNILTLYRSVTMRSPSARQTPWRDLCRWFYNALLVASDRHTTGLRARRNNAAGIA
jgi:predicted transposase YbfD/YdcC